MIDLKFTSAAKPEGRWGEERTQDKRLCMKKKSLRLQFGVEEERDKQHVWGYNHQLTLFICCVVSARLFHHRHTVGSSEYIKTARKTESGGWGRESGGHGRSIFLRETSASAFCLTFSFFHFARRNVIFTFCPAFILYPLSLPLCLALSISSQK